MSDEAEVVQVEETEQTTEVEQLTEEVTAESEQAEQGEAATPPGDDAAAKPKKSGVQDRINELTRQRHEKERALESARLEAEYWKSQVIQKPQQTTAAPAGEPTVEQFDSYEDYLKAAARYEAKAELAAAQREMSQTQRQQQLAERQRAIHERADTLELEDFADVVYSPNLQISQEMVDIALDSEKGAELLYYLGKNPAESARIARMDSSRAGYELARLEASLEMPRAKHVTSAPPPIKPISGGGEPPQMDQEKMTPEQWRDWRNEQLRSKGVH